MDNLRMNGVLISLGVLGMALMGCTDQSRQEYAQAGQETKSAVKIDLKHGERDAKTDLRDSNHKVKEEERQLDSATLSPRIKAALAATTSLHSSGISVTTVGKHVTLGGNVPSTEEKKRAEKVAVAVAGPTVTVLDQIAVKPPN